MYLKSIEINGFKSFANKTVMQFHNGITGIVGPNGSGKSNVADAVRWVLGEQRIKQLRGGTMQDVIFAGTQNRKPLGYAYVAITLSNEDHALPVSYNEVTVARRLYRSGESEYLLNGSPCRLKDVNELFYDTGIGKEGYSIIGQGQIDKILSGRPEDRRELFDEAAGIVKFKRRKLEAQKKLEGEEQNLARVGDILSELSRQVGPLEKQAEKAKEYLRLKEELKAYDVNLFLREYEEDRKNLETLTANRDAAQEELDQVRENAEKTKENCDNSAKEVVALEEKIAAANEELTKERLLKQELEGEKKVLEEQIRAAEANAEERSERLITIEEELKNRDSLIADNEKAAADNVAALADLSGMVREKEEELEKAQEKTGKIREQIDALGQEHIVLLEKKTSLTSERQRCDTMLEQIHLRRSQVGSHLENLKKEIETHKQNIASYTETLEKISGSIDSLNAENESSGKELIECQEKAATMTQNLESVQNVYHRNASRLDALKAIAERYDGYGVSIRKVMELKGSETGLLGVVADLIRTKKEYETAIETALGSAIQNIVTEDEDTAKRMIAFLKENRYGRATFLPLNAMKNPVPFKQTDALDEPGVIGLAASLVNTEPKYTQMVEQLLGRTVVVDNIDNAVKLARRFRYSLRIVTLDGELLSPGGSMTGGAFKNNLNLLGRRREIESLTEETERSRKKVEELKNGIDTVKERRNSLRDKVREIGEKMQQLYIEQNTAQMQKKEAEGRLTETEDRLKTYDLETGQIRSKIMELNRLKTQSDMDLEKLSGEEKKLQDKTEKQQDLLDDALEESERIRQELESVRLERASKEQNGTFLEGEHTRFENEKEQLLTEKDQIIGAGKEGEASLREKRAKIISIDEDAAACEERGKTLATGLGKLDQEKNTLTNTQRALYEQREELQERAGLLDKEVFRLNSQIEKLEENAESRSSYMWEEYGLTYSTAEALMRDDLGSPSTWRKEMNALKRQIRELGNVNVNAIEEYRETSERYVFLKGQYEDLVKAREALLKIIGDLDKGMRKQFNEQFAKIATEFDKTFKEMFGGGTGTLELVEGEDVLESGILINAQPPGKKLQNMMQLSGGEKALTAIALLFAIQNLKPSPFCLLDEIEAALDESNVDRYAQYLHKLTKNTQFIIITHRRGTMAASDRLYGITMQEKGVSALVSVDLVKDDLDK